MLSVARYVKFSKKPKKKLKNIIISILISAVSKIEYAKMRSGIRRKIMIASGIDPLPSNKVHKSKKDYKRKKLNKRELRKYIE